MAVTQYVGSRYVPIFADPAEWSSTKAYEPLTIVLHQGNSFTSKRFVPVGVDITNTDFWAETGNYNAQVEQYRREVSAFDGRITSVEEATADLSQAVEAVTKSLENHLYVHELGAGGSCYIIEYNGVFICYDVAATTSNEATLRAALRGVLTNNKLSAVICSHFHYDHSGKPNVIAEFCDDQTEAFMQMPPTEINGDYEYFMERLALFTAAFPNAQVPVNNSVHTYGDIMVRLFNTLTVNRGVYDITPHNASADFLGNASGLNNYSLIAEFVTPNGSYCNTGDAESVAQELNAQFMKSVDVLHNPHHVSNFTGYIQFFTNASPKLLETVAGVSSVFAMRRRFVNAIVERLGVDLIVTNEAPFTIDIYKGTVSHDAAYWASPTVPVSVNGNHLDYYTFVASSYFNRNPWYLFELTPAALVNFIQYTGIKGRYHLSTSTSGLDHVEAAYLFGELLYPDAAWLGITMKDEHTLPDNVYLDFEIDKAGITFSRARDSQRGALFKVSYLFVSSTSYVTRYFIEGAYSRNIGDSLTFADTSNTMVIPTGELRYLYNTTNQMCVTVIDTNDTQHIVPVFRINSSPNSVSNKMEGMLLLSTTRDLVVARVTTTGSISAFKFHLNGDASETLHVGGYTILG